MDAFMSICWAAAPSLLVGIFMAVFAARQRRHMRRREAAERAKREESRLNLNLTFAAAQLSHATAMAIKRGKPNGEIEEAVEVYAQAIGEYRSFEREQMARLREK